MTAIHFESNAFAGMPFFTSLTFNCLIFKSIDPNIVWGFERSFRNLRFIGFTQRISFQDLFGGGFPILRTIEITNHQAVHVLAPGNFTRLPKIITLDITKTNIEVIRKGTFDEVATTLRFIHLCGLNLLRIDPAVFYKFLLIEPDGSAAAGVPSHLNKPKSLLLHENIIFCDCGFYELKYLILVNFGITSTLNSLQCIRAGNLQINDNFFMRCWLQRIHLKTIHLKSNDLDYIVYPKIYIQVERNESAAVIFITGRLPPSFQILFILFDAGESFNGISNEQAWLRQSTRCVHMALPSKLFEIMIDPARFMFISVHSFTPRRIWPLNMKTLRPTHFGPVDLEPNFLLYTIGFGSIICLMGFIFGFAVGFFRVRSSTVAESTQLKQADPNEYNRRSAIVETGLVNRFDTI